jgi:TrpR-related protein YerC/YecD
MESKIKDENTDFLFDCILKLDSMEECYAFFEDLCTIPEIRAMAQRAVVAKMLSEKTVYNDIVARTGASTATISRVNRSLSYGAGGYASVFEKEA